MRGAQAVPSHHCQPVVLSTDSVGTLHPWQTEIRLVFAPEGSRCPDGNGMGISITFTTEKARVVSTKILGGCVKE